MDGILFKDLSKRIIGMAFNVHNVLGPGLLESAYHGALCIELKNGGVGFKKEVIYPLYYRGELASAYIADLVVDNKVIIEVKSVNSLNNVMEAQLINYLRLSKLKVGYLINFRNTRVEFKRVLNNSS